MHDHTNKLDSYKHTYVYEYTIYKHASVAMHI